MSRVRVQSYGPSKSARALAEALGVKRILSKGSKFRGRPSDVIINWGNPKTVHNSTYLNPLDSVRIASNKLSTFKALQSAEVPIPAFGTDTSFAEETDLVVARTTLTGHSGEGIVVGIPSELPHAPLYVQYIEKVAEYRAIVVNESVVDFKQKLKRRDAESHDPHVWNHDNNYVFCRNNINHPEQADTIAVKALQALGLKYGAVDIIEDAEGNLYTLEINTAFGLVGSTTQLVADAIQELL